MGLGFGLSGRWRSKLGRKLGQMTRVFCRGRGRIALKTPFSGSFSGPLRKPMFELGRRNCSIGFRSGEDRVFRQVSTRAGADCTEWRRARALAWGPCANRDCPWLTILLSRFFLSKVGTRNLLDVEEEGLRRWIGP